MSAEGFVDIFFPQFHEFVALGKTMGIEGWVTAFHADCMNFVYILGHCHQSRHGTERFAHVIHIEARHNDSDTLFSQLFADVDDAVVEKLGLVYPHDIYIA